MTVEQFREALEAHCIDEVRLWRSADCWHARAYHASGAIVGHGQSATGMLEAIAQMLDQIGAGACVRDLEAIY